MGGGDKFSTVGGRTINGLVTTRSKNTGIPEDKLMKMPYRLVRLKNIDQVTIDTEEKDEKVNLTGAEAFNYLHKQDGGDII